MKTTQGKDNGGKLNWTFRRKKIMGLMKDKIDQMIRYINFLLFLKNKNA
jgi:hypothetical protein